ncbi:acetamidase regulatory protein, partial [Lasiosphaeria hispida]
ACAVCHTRKVRCDAPDVGFPCTNCHNASRDADCRVHQKRKRTPRRLWTDPSPTTPDSTAPTPHGLPQQVPLSEPQASTSLNGIRLVSTPLDASPSSMTDGLLHLYERHLVEFVDKPRIEDRPIDKNARLVYIGTDVANIHFLAGQQFGDRVQHICHFPTNQLARRDTCHEPDRLPVEAFQLRTRAVVDQLLDAYFSHVNPGFPVVGQDLFIAQYRARDPQNPPSLLLLQAILLAGAHALYDSPETMKATFFRCAKSLFDARFERNRDTIVQAALLLSWHADGPEDVAANAWFWIGLTIRTATGLRMHRDAGESTIVPHNKSMWRRVWWLLFQCDVLLSLQYGRPQSIRLGDCDVKFLQPSDFQNCGANTQVGYVIHTTKLCIIMSDGLRERYRLSSTPENRWLSLLKLDEAPAQWSLQLPESLHMRPDASSNLWPGYLQLQYNTALLLLHRSSQPTQEDTQVCAMAASFIQSIFQGICERGDLRSLWVSAVDCIFAALIQINVEVRTSNPLIALPALMRYDATLSSLRQLADYWPNAQSILHFFESIRGSKGVFQDVSGGPTEGTWARSIQVQCILGNAAFAPISPGKTTMRSHEEVVGSITLRSLIHFTAPDARVAGPDGNATQPRVVSEFTEASHEWRNTYWQQMDLNDDFLFTF